MATHYEQNVRSKFESVLELSQDQLNALRVGDMDRFRHALAAKGAVIESLIGKFKMVSNDPAILAIIPKIQSNERESERLIQARLSRTREELAKIEQSKTATKAYGKTLRKTPSFLPSLETPMMFDHQR